MPTGAKITFGSSVPGRPHSLKPMPTKNLVSSNVDDLRPEYDLALLKGGVRGKYHARATAGTTLVLLEPDVAKAFPSGPAVNRALRAFLRTERGRLPNKALQPSSGAQRKAKSRKSARAARG
jgi:hypothetical protein